MCESCNSFPELCNAILNNSNQLCIVKIILLLDPTVSGIYTHKMKTIRFNARTKKIFLGILTVMIMLPFSLDAEKIPFLQSSIAPAAEGYVKVRKDNNNNIVIKIHIKNMAEIESLDPAMKTYVVWMLTDRETTENIGRINSSNRLKVSFETVSSFQPIKIFITAEKDESTSVPGEMIILTTDNFYN